MIIPALAFAAATAAAIPAGSAAPPCAACVRWELTAVQAARLAADTSDLHGIALLIPAGAADASALSRRGASVGVRAELDAAGGVALDGVEAVVLVLPAAAARPEERLYAMKTAATGLRARHSPLRVGVEGTSRELAALAAGGASAYLDLVVADDAAAGVLPGVERWTRTRAQSPEDVLAATQDAPGTVLAPWAGEGAPGDPPFALAALRDLLTPALALMPDVEVGCEGGSGTPVPCAGTAFLHESGDAVVFVRPTGGEVGAIVLRAPEPVVAAETPAAPAARLYDLAAPPAPQPAESRVAPGATRIAVPPRARAFVLQVEGWGAAHARFGAGVEVVAGRELTVEEVLARHQAWALRQRQAVPRDIATGTLVITFQVPGLSAPVTVNADVTLYSSPGGLEVEQRSLRLNGLPLAHGGVPRLPILEPERVAAPPLSITLGEAYRYRLEGRGRAGGRDCYRVVFAPAAGAGPSYRGRAWIDAATFALVRMEAVQTGLRGAIVSSRQVEEYAAVAHAGRTLWLTARTEVHQVYEGPGHRTPIDRVLAISRHEPDPPDFEGRLAAAHASEAVMLRETPKGFEYLRKARPSERAASGGAERVPAGRSTAVKTLALGVIVDPNIGDPLPFAGAGYSDLDFLGSGTQLNAFLAGAFAQLSWSAPTLGGSAFRLEAAGFASLVEYNDRVFRRGVEQYPENLRQRPARLVVDLSHPLAARVRARAGYELSYIRLRRSDLTAGGFREPQSALAHGLRLALDAERGAWSGSLWWRPAWRPRWRTWGFADAPEDAADARAYQRYGVRLARAFVASPRVSGRLELSAMAGRRLDRFSRFSFDGFEERLTGYPVSSVRFDRGLVGRSALVWQARPFLRAQAWADAARVRDSGFEFQARTLTGVGAGLETVLPFRSLLAVEWGYGIQGRDRDGRVGTHTVRVTAYRVF